MIATFALAETITSPTINEYNGNLRVSEEPKDVPPCVESKTELYKLALSQDVRKYGLSYHLLNDLIQCESGWNDKAVGDNGKAYSLLQFHRPTFDRFCEGEYENPIDQIHCATKMISEGLESHWTCHYKITRLNHT